MRRIASALAIAFGLAFASASAFAIAATPAAAADPSYHDMYRLESAENKVIIDGSKQSGTTVQVKKGDFVEVQFSQLYRDEHVWWFNGIKPAWTEFFLLQHFEGPPIIDGRVQLKMPGYMAFTFEAKEAGTYKLVFKQGKRIDDLENQRFQTPDQTVEITLEVQ